MKKIVGICLIFCLLLCACGQSAEATWQEQYDLGVRYLSEGNYQEAIIAFTAAIEIDAKRPEAYIGLADTYIALGSYDEAKVVLENALEQVDNLAAVQSKLNEVTGLLQENSNSSEDEKLNGDNQTPSNEPDLSVRPDTENGTQLEVAGEGGLFPNDAEQTDGAGEDTGEGDASAEYLTENKDPSAAEAGAYRSDVTNWFDDSPAGTAEISFLSDTEALVCFNVLPSIELGGENNYTFDLRSSGWSEEYEECLWEIHSYISTDQDGQIRTAHAYYWNLERSVSGQDELAVELHSVQIDESSRTVSWILLVKDSDSFNFFDLDEGIAYAVINVY